MPIHLFWGDDEAARNRAVEALITAKLDPSWAAINLSRLDGSDADQAAAALAEARTPPLGSAAPFATSARPSWPPSSRPTWR
jgi:DNA polymerase-3 subunit delta